MSRLNTHGIGLLRILASLTLKLRTVWVALAMGACVCAGCQSSAANESGAHAPAVTARSADAAPVLPRILVFSRTAAFRHKSIPQGVQAVTQIGAGLWVVDATEDSNAFTAENLKKYRAVVFLSTTGDILDAPQQQALEGYIHAGGGWVGIHAASDTEYGWPWYGQLVGAWFASHPPIQKATVVVEDRTHRSTQMLPAAWERTDEWYAFRTNPRKTDSIHVLASLDEKTYAPAQAAMGDHPIAWYHLFEGGRAWYTAGGHTIESFSEPLFREHLREGISWACGLPLNQVPAANAPAKPLASQSNIKGAHHHSDTRILAAGLPLAAAIPLPILLGSLTVVVAIFCGVVGQGVKGPLLNWCFPGAGHLALGYQRRGVLAMTAIVSLFLIGLLIGGVDAVDSSEDAPWFLAQSGNGPLAFAVDWCNQSVLKTGKVGELLPAPAPLDPLGRPLPGQFTMSSYKSLGAANEFGTLFIALGGMMNLVLIMDISRRERAEHPNA